MYKNMSTGGALLAVAAVALTSGSTAALAQAQGVSGYVQDSSRAYVRALNAGVCVRTGYWTPSMAVFECDPDLVPKPAPAPAKPAPVTKPAPAAPAKPAAPFKPAPFTPATPGKPKPPAAAVKPVVEKVTLQSDALFDFDKAVIRKDAQSTLDGLVAKMKGVNLEVVIAVGHADRIGSDAYNMRLSTRRAEAVKAYLVGKGIPANRIYTEGKGERQPVKNCGPMAAKELIACLQPNRRVEVEVVGTRQR
ncbi:MAG: OmpA family protein [Burkholderiales bacterium]|nr:OmpA family protein [Burkholderiales bacterium]